MPLAAELTVFIGENKAVSKIYSNSERFFIITIGDDFESDLLYEGQEITYNFKVTGDYLIKCANYNQAKCKVTVFKE
jgi:hypothetical protein